ncbi:hypothetical protein [Alicyclobacillus sp. SO9]|uniref:hypothetical protein n=1 Tax=Alicyclobacillus sp. SO9 TaxID=2665646 RepID=UPI0018E73E69|nr:hypothetical protein [Alicyclobacillus sp. SO9]QQE80583.1 hypothetical protein GI364_09335 [Alicyclobacillus sp. SO9]
MEEDTKIQEKIIEELRQINRRLDSIERSYQGIGGRKSWGTPQLWPLIPIVAIVMWGLTQIFH